MSIAKKLAETIQNIKDKEEWKLERAKLLERISRLENDLRGPVNLAMDCISGPCPPLETKREKKLKFIKKNVESILKYIGFLTTLSLYTYAVSLWASM